MRMIWLSKKESKRRSTLATDFFWKDLEEQLRMTARRLLEEALLAERRLGGDFDRQILWMFASGLSTQREEHFSTRFFGECAFSSSTARHLVRELR